MTEPDEALIWAREDAADLYDTWDAPRILAGEFDWWPDIKLRVRFYRAGQAASAERIKALEMLLRECAAALEAEIQGRSANDLPRRVERDMQPVKEARNLLKEAGQ